MKNKKLEEMPMAAVKNMKGKENEKK
jgi:hypothetical protein